MSGRMASNSEWPEAAGPKASEPSLGSLSLSTLPALDTIWKEGSLSNCFFQQAVRAGKYIPEEGICQEADPLDMVLR